MTIPLKLCPFCGGDSFENLDAARRGGPVMCILCGACGPSPIGRVAARGIADGLEAWNTRHVETAAPDPLGEWLAARSGRHAMVSHRGASITDGRFRVDLTEGMDVIAIGYGLTREEAEADATNALMRRG